MIMSEFFDALEKAKHIGEVIAGNISPEGSNDILQKGKAANIGEVREWSGKKFRKQANGNWVEVSGSHEMSKEEHWQEAGEARGSGTMSSHSKSIFKRKENEHTEQASKLSDKEHSDEEVGLKSSGSKIPSGEFEGDFYNSKGDKMFVRVYKDGVVKVEDSNVRKDFENKDQAWKFLSSRGYSNTEKENTERIKTK